MLIVGQSGWSLATALSGTVLTAYLLVLGVLMVYGIHRYWLVHRFWRDGRELWNGDSARPEVQSVDDWPMVTVQLPMYNETAVARRAIEAACALDYPTDRLEIQVLDDSTDGSEMIAREVVASMALRGHDVCLIHRQDRIGFKAGALAEGLQTAKGEFVAVFDADFVPGADFLRQTIGHFSDSRVGMVQTRWSHLNRGDSALTRSQAVFLDGHFVIEHTARAGSGRWFNFNGTGGIWRRTCIEDSGGWMSDTLTEDVDLSYRAQMRGWRFVYDPTLACPGELPPYVSGFKTQQHRWTKGSIQTGLKLLGSIWRSDGTLGQKIEATFHLTSPGVSVFVILLTLLVFPSFLIPFESVNAPVWQSGLFGLTVLVLATGSAGTFYLASQLAQGIAWWKSLAMLPMVLALGIGISVNNARGVIEALMGSVSPFVRTPKFGERRTSERVPGGRVCLRCGVMETVLGLFMVASIGLALWSGQGLLSVPFLALFAVGYLAVGVGSMFDGRLKIS